MKPLPQKTSKMRQVEANQGMEIEELLRRLFVDENRSIEAIATKLNVSYPVVISWLRQAGIYGRKLNL